MPPLRLGNRVRDRKRQIDDLEESGDDAFISVPLLLLPGNAHPADKLSILPTLQVKADRNVR